MPTELEYQAHTPGCAKRTRNWFSLCSCGFDTQVSVALGEKVDSMKVFASGAKSTTKKPRYDLIPLRALELLAERFGYGADRHGERNYRKGINDQEFITDRVNHLIEHVQKFAETRTREDLAAILCNAAILADLRADTQEVQ